MYSLGVIGESREPWLREPVEMTVEYIKAVAAHLCCHHQVLGAVGSSIGPRKWAQSSWSGIHSSNRGVSWAQSQVRYVFPSIIPICVLVVLKRTWTGAWYSCGLIPMTVRSTPRQFGLLHPTTASCQLGLKWRNTASFSHPASKLAAWSTAEPCHGGVGRGKALHTELQVKNQQLLPCFCYKQRKKTPQTMRPNTASKPAQQDGVFTHKLEECGHNMHAITLPKVLNTLIGGSSQKKCNQISHKKNKTVEKQEKKNTWDYRYTLSTTFPAHPFLLSQCLHQQQKSAIPFPDSSPKWHLWGWTPRGVALDSALVRSKRS